jgi:hypothetical protein
MEATDAARTSSYLMRARQSMSARTSLITPQVTIGVHRYTMSEPSGSDRCNELVSSRCNRLRIRLTSRSELGIDLSACAFLAGFVSFGGLAHVVAGWPGAGSLTLGSGWGAAGVGFAGFRRAGRSGSIWRMLRNPPPDPGRGEAARWAGQPQVGVEVAGEVLLGVAGEDEQGAPVGGGRVAEPGPGPP